MLFYSFCSPVIMASHMKLGWRPSLGGAEIRKVFLIQILLVLVHTPLLQSLESSIKIDLRGKGGRRGGGW